MLCSGNTSTAKLVFHRCCYIRSKMWLSLHLDTRQYHRHELRLSPPSKRQSFSFRANGRC
jgi:hypothetical protein